NALGSLIFRCNSDLGVLQIGIRAKVIENQQSCLLHHLRLPTLPSTPILSQGRYFGELTRSCRTKVLYESSYMADSAVIVPTIELVSPPEGTEPVILPPSTDIATTGARITVRL
ncbi:hypothetical protein Tco_0981758, partial [Tanacetum coccineum]